MKTALVAIECNEKNIEEWCRWHLKLGFDQIFIGANNCEVPKIDIAGVQVFSWNVRDDVSAQHSLYNEFIRQCWRHFDWIAFIDLDEYIWLSGKNVKQFLDMYRDVDVLQLNWVPFCATEEIEEPADSLLKRFTWRSILPNKHCKPILHVSKCIVDGYGQRMHFFNPHIVGMPGAIPHQALDGRRVVGPFNENADISNGYVAHFYSKTKKEFAQKIERGRPDSPKNSTSQYNYDDASRESMWKIYEEYNRPEMQDKSLLEYYNKEA